MFDDSPIQVFTHHYKGPKAIFENSESQYNNWIVLAVDQGVFEYGIGNQTGEASFGDIIFCPPGTPIRRRALTPLSLYFLVFNFSESIINRTDIKPTFDIPIGKVTLHDHARLASNFSYIRQCTMPNNSIQSKFLAHVVYDLIFICAVEMQRVVNHKDVFVQQASDFIRDHFREELRLQDVAKQFGFNQSQFTRRFRTAIGMNPNDYLTSLRLDCARSLLLETDDTIEVIAAACGFQSGFYLSRVFTAHLQTTPSQYRKSYRL